MMNRIVTKMSMMIIVRNIVTKVKDTANKLIRFLDSFKIVNKYEKKKKIKFYQELINLKNPTNLKKTHQFLQFRSYQKLIPF